ncbi:fatty acyl-CoA synthetase [Amphritea japonica]|uniref:Fatty-acyl-CoA synthase n=1 Tax=Amphritea japonica ATCC BAA-1530 TaxID=1278309 RepID=A0A7R6PIG2_9GAMM|nr:fatty acyl-CoA synthetase [Amphritea japonica]BBB27117.1 fatty-acyl-CoA synthase [Amphritea japonica ATCC BAA-1530]
MYTASTTSLINTTRNRNISDLVTLQALKNPSKIALKYDGHSDTFEELNNCIDRAANALKAAGITPGERVACLSHNNRSFVIFRFAAIRAGAIFTPINFMLNATDITYILENSGAVAIIAEDTLCEVADQAIAQMESKPKVKAYINFSGTQVADSWLNSNDWITFEDDSPVVCETGEDDPVQIMYTSGTESHPKGVILSSRALIAQYVTCIVDGKMEQSDIELHCLPLFHCAQLDCFLTVDLYLGATSILMPGADPGAMLEQIEKEKINKLFCPPTVWIALLRHPDFDKRDLSSLNKGYYGASIMPTAIIEELSERLPNMRLWNFYGQTELAPVATILQPEDQLSKLGSAGKPGLNINTRIVDDEDNEVPRNTVGEIVHQSPQATLGYLGNEEKTAEAFCNGWFHSGDLGYMDEEGYIFVVDRKKDMIKSGGENVASREVEEKLFQHPKIAEVAVFGLPHEKWIEAVSAVIVPREGESLTRDEIASFCRENLTSYKRPRNIFLAESLPKNASGKILKRELRATYIDS